MSNVYVRMPYDPTGRSPDNLVGSEPHDLVTVSGFPYKIITLVNGGFYNRGLRVYDANYNLLTLNQDYIITYFFQNASIKVGLDICAAIVFLDPARVGRVYVSAQMVGGDVAFSLTVIQDYIAFYHTKPSGYVPMTMDYAGNEPIWKPGELDKERWHLDTYQPFNNEIYYLSRSWLGGTGNYETDYRKKVVDEYNNFLDLFNDRLQRHIDDKANPHVDNKSHVGLGLVENYKVATETEARQGASNTLYLTPALAYAEVDELAIKPLNVHIANRQNPHRTTPDKINAPTKAAVNVELGKKYGINDTVANSNYFTDGARNLTYSDLYNEARTNIPAPNFTGGPGIGFMNSARLGVGAPTPTSVLRDNGRWVEWQAILDEFGGMSTPSVLVMQGYRNLTPQQAFAAATNQPWAWSAPEGSLILYELDVKYTWASGRVVTLTHTVCYGAMKVNGSWINIVNT